MRIRVTFYPEKSPLILPCHYNRIVQGFIYDNLDPVVADRVHNKGFVDPESRRSLKFFSFSRLLPGSSMIVKAGSIHLTGPISLVICSPHEAFMESFVTRLLVRQSFLLGRSRVVIGRVEVLANPQYAETSYIRTLSPIVARSTVNAEGKGKREVYYGPHDENFERLVLANLRRKVRAWYGRDVEGGSIRAISVGDRNKHIVKYKGTVIEGWSGVYEIKLPEEMFRMAFDAGLGEKNSQGFGCIELWKGR